MKQYRATFTDGNGKQHTTYRTTKKEYKYFWFIHGREYGSHVLNGKSEQFNDEWIESGFTTKPEIGKVSYHYGKERDLVGRDWKGEKFETHTRILRQGLVEVELVRE